MKYVEEGTNYSHSVGYEYDKINNLSKLVETINGVERQTSYSYDLDNRVTSVTIGDSSRVYSYDSLSRISQWVTKHGNTTVFSDGFTFVAPTTDTTSGQIATHTITAGNTNSTYSYSYDDNGNILSISDGTNTTSYTYDTANQLLRENNQAANKTYVWVYDNAGNILSRTEYAYTTDANPTSPVDTVTYTYGDSEWGDLLTAYNGQTISYDQIGNPTNDGFWVYTWEHGRQLASMTNGSTTWNYTYNSDGLRTSRTNGTTAYSYVYNGSTLSQMTVDGNTLTFSYDSNGLPMAVTYNGTEYYYITNIQGDVIGILDSSGATVVTYTYDAWGNHLSTTGSLSSTLGTHNPLRYRGYIFDVETAIYYVQTRYYCSDIGRWLNADSLVSNAGTSFHGYNLFAYCFNNPVNLEDTTGNWPQWTKDAVKWLATNIVKPIVNATQTVGEKIDITGTVGLTASGTPSFWIFNGQIGVSGDTKGNIAIQAAGGGGLTGGTPGISLSGFASVTNAPNVKNLEGEYAQLGSSIAAPVGGVPLAVGADFMLLPDTPNKRMYHGLTGSLGFGTPGRDFHVEWGETTTIFRINIYEVADDIYDWIMGW